MTVYEVIKNNNLGDFEKRYSNGIKYIATPNLTTLGGKEVKSVEIDFKQKIAKITVENFEED